MRAKQPAAERSAAGKNKTYYNSINYFCDYLNIRTNNRG